MKLNPNCIRDILLTVENKDFGTALSLESLCEQLPNYSQSELHYTCLKLNEGGYLDLLTYSSLDSIVPYIIQINDLTFCGHEFLEPIRSTPVWNKTVDKLKNVGSFSLSTIKEISVNVLSELIKSQF